MQTNVEDRFWPRVDKSGDCWIWIGGKTKAGYGRISIGGQYYYAHRIAYELVNGCIPAGNGLDHRHTCPKHCVNPDHLRIATQKQNMENLKGAQRNNLSSGVRGVTWDKNRQKWMGKVKHYGKHVYVGRFSTITDAEAAVISKRLELFTHNDADRMVSA